MLFTSSVLRPNPIHNPFRTYYTERYVSAEVGVGGCRQFHGHITVYGARNAGTIWARLYQLRQGEVQMCLS